MVQTITEKLYEFTDHAVLAQHFHNDQYQVGSRSTLGQFARQFEADDLWYQHRHRLAKHGGFCFDAADTPAEYAKTVNHGGMRVGTNQCIGVSLTDAIVLHVEHDTAQVLEVNLMNDAGIRWYHFEIGEGFLAPLQEAVTFLVALVFDFGIQIDGVLVTEAVDLDRVIDDQFRRLQRIDFLRVATERLHGITHGGQIDNCGYTGEVLHQHARRAIGYFLTRLSLRIPVDDGFNILPGDGFVVFKAQQVFEQNLE